MVNFEIASLGKRLGAFIIDLLILGGAMIAVMLFFAFFFAEGETKFYVLFFMFLFYTLAFEILTEGTTPGKMAMGLRVLKFSGSPASVLDYVIRWAFRWLDIWGSLGAVAGFFCISSPYGQRLGDVLAGTTVIAFDKKERVSLSDLLEMQSKEDYTPSFPQVEMLSDADMLLVKGAITRYQKSQNEAYTTAIGELVIKLKTELNIRQKTPDSIAFLRQLLKDYVVLTR